MDSPRDRLTHAVTEYVAAAESGSCESVVALRRLVERLESDWLRQVGELERHGEWRASRPRSFRSWLTHACRMPAGKASWAVRLARGFRALPRLRAACQSGEVPVEHATEIVRTLGDTPPSLRAIGEETLLTHTRELQHADVVKVCRRWLDVADPDGTLGREDRLFGRRRLALGELGDMTRIAGWLHPEGGLIVRKALHTAAGPPRTGDERSGEQRLADALVEICDQWLRHTPGRDSRGRRPHLVIQASPDSLVSGTGAAPAPVDEDGHELGRRALLRLACDATITPMLLDGDGVPLKLGRTTRRVPHSLWLALVARDRHCVFPRCTAPPSECDAHHLVPWTQGGATDLDNLVLLFRRHHVAVHEGGWVLERDHSGRTTAAQRRPDPDRANARMTGIPGRHHRPLLE